ncbi:Nramp family divalent metal transporter [Mucilaginibacter sp. UYCu711]|uniref:Nramp family divalent metal transporter n=1 Tax=Mucilaginibacter sp. UYCu711 TaxID=3156339 RepID=UPI003D217E78
MVKKTKLPVRLKNIFKTLGPGLVTGASDDDPSGIATYSQAGAQFGLATLWTALITFPLMAAMQEMCARIGLVTQKGLTSTIKDHYPKWVLWVMVGVSFPAITLNIGADIAGMGAAANLLVPAIPAFAFSILFTIAILLAVIFYSYRKLAAILKWTCIVLLVYILVPFSTTINWLAVIKAAVVPTIQFNKAYVAILVGILGTTISPYLFFWQTTMEAEDIKQNSKTLIINKKIIRDMRKDVDVGMLFSNLVMFFIILTCGSVLYTHGQRDINTVEQAATALKPIAGNLAYLLFSVGIIGTGFLAIPVLSGSLSYMFAEAFNWDEGLDKKFFEARPFYSVVIISLIVGLSLNFIGISPIQGLIYSAVLYGLTSPIIIFIVLHISNNKTIMGTNTNSLTANILGGLSFLLMIVAAVTLVYMQFK